MKTQHTPGPWTIGPTSSFASGNWRIVTTHDGTTNICACHGTIITDAEMHPMNQTRDANARLIAAAPDLLAALQAAVAQLDRFAGALATDQIQQHWDDDADQAQQQARAALARATA